MTPQRDRTAPHGAFAIGRRRRRLPIVLGAALVVVAAVILGGSAYVTGSSSTQFLGAGDAILIQTSSIGSFTISASWSGANSSTIVWLVWGSAACTGESGVVARGVGPAGSFHALVAPSYIYSLYGCNGSNPEALTLTYHLSGIVTPIELLTILPFGVGGALIAFGLKGRRESF